MQIVSIRDSLHEMSKPVFWEKLKNIWKCYLLKILLRVLSINIDQYVICYMNEHHQLLGLEFMEHLTT